MLAAFVLMTYLAIGLLSVVLRRGWRMLEGRSGYVEDPLLVVFAWPAFFIAAVFILFDLGTDA